MDKILIQGLRVPCRIGCESEERLLAQMLELNLKIGLRDAEAAQSGRLQDTVCYKSVCELIRRHSAQREWGLLEQFAEDLVRLVFENFPAAKNISLEIHKFVIPETEFTGLEIFRER